MGIQMKFIFGVTLLVIQLSSARAGIASTTADIVTSIVDGHFKKVFEEVGTLKEEDLQTVMNDVILDVYRYDFRNIDLILQFVDSNGTETNVSFAVFKALSNQLRSDVDYLYRLKILTSFNKKRFNLKDEKVLSVKNELQKSAKSLIVDVLKVALKNKDTPKISAISENIRENVPSLFKKVIKRILDKAFDEIDTHYLVKFFMSHKYVSQSMWVYSAVFNKTSSNLDQNLTVTLAFGIKQALVKSTDWESIEEGFRLANKLPLSTRNLAFFNGFIAIINKKYGEYLYAASDGFYLWDPSRQSRQIFTWTPKENITQGRWGVEQNGDAYWIRISGTDSPKGFLFTWLPGSPDDNAPKQFDWLFEPSGDYVYIKSTYYNEYLYASEEHEGFGYDRRMIHTERKKIPGSLWKIEPYYTT